MTQTVALNEALKIVAQARFNAASAKPVWDLLGRVRTYLDKQMAETMAAELAA